jgi:hypothetical protein
MLLIICNLFRTFYYILKDANLWRYLCQHPGVYLRPCARLSAPSWYEQYKTKGKWEGERERSEGEGRMGYRLLKRGKGRRNCHRDTRDRLVSCCIEYVSMIDILLAFIIEEWREERRGRDLTPHCSL